MARVSLKYNARLTKPQVIAETFVRHPKLDSIAEHRSKILVGPRGVGKTTLLKLLSPLGLLHLQKREEYADFDLDYLPLYIPADTLWKGEADSITDAVERKKNGLDEDLGEVLQNALFVDYSFYEVLASLQDAIRVGRVLEDQANEKSWAVNFDERDEKEVCRYLSDAWNLKREAQSFLGLKLELNDRQNLHSSIVSGLQPLDAATILSADKLDFFVKIRAFFDVIKEFTGKDSWGLHFDEMEMAPKSILKKLYENTRSFDQRVAIKFSLFPYAEFVDFGSEENIGRTSPLEGPDFDAIVLNGHFSTDDYSFAEGLVDWICTSHGISLSDLRNYTNGAVPKKFIRFSQAGHPVRKHADIFASLSKRDSSFASYLSKKELDLEGFRELDNTQHAESVRKISSLAEFRNVYLRSFSQKSEDSDGEADLYPVKSYSYYFAFDRLLRLTEQNPRTVQFYFEPLAKALKDNRAPQPSLNEAIRINTDRARALYATQVVPFDPLRGHVFNVLDIVDAFGYEVHERLLKKSFSDQPTMTFMATRKLDSHLRRLVGIAMNTGALIPDLEGGASRILTTVVDVRFRVSYEIAAFYPIPPYLGGTRRFSSIDNIIDKPADLLSWMDDDT